jgi:DNA-binding MarR family transcriptional regulator
MKSLSQNQFAVLTRLNEAERSGRFLVAGDFADIATVSSGRQEWAGPVLRSLLAKELAERLPKRSAGGYHWRITASGRKALLEHQ